MLEEWVNTFHSGRVASPFSSSWMMRPGSTRGVRTSNCVSTLATPESMPMARVKTLNTEPGS